VLQFDCAKPHTNNSSRMKTIKVVRIEFAAVARVKVLSDVTHFEEPEHDCLIFYNQIQIPELTK